MKQLLKERQDASQEVGTPSVSPSTSTLTTPKRNRHIIDNARNFVLSGNTDAAIESINCIETLIEGFEYVHSKAVLAEDEQQQEAALAAEMSAGPRSRARLGPARAYRGADIAAMLPAYLEKQAEKKRKAEQLAARREAAGGRGGRGRRRGTRGARGVRGTGRGRGRGRKSTGSSGLSRATITDEGSMEMQDEETSEEDHEDDAVAHEDDQDNVPLGAHVGRDYTPAAGRSVTPEDLSWMSEVRLGKRKRAPPRRFGQD